MAFLSFIDQFRERVLSPAIDTQMRLAMQNGIEATQAAAPVLTGKLKASIGGIYNQADKVVTIYCDVPYGAMQNNGYKSRSGRLVPGKHFMEAGLKAMGRTWGGSVEVQFATLAPAYHKRTVLHTGGKVGRAKLRLGHKYPKR